MMERLTSLPLPGFELDKFSLAVDLDDTESGVVRDVTRATFNGGCDGWLLPSRCVEDE